MKTHQLIEATCPDCRGPLSVNDHDGLREYGCLVGHAYTAVGLLQAHSEAQEKAVWSAVVALEEATKLVEAVAADLPPAVVERLEKQAQEKRQQAQEIRSILERLEPFGIE
jgi:two-component system chemotaxis response regulator CheB